MMYQRMSKTLTLAALRLLPSQCKAASGLVERCACELEKRLVKVKLARLQANHFASGDMPAQTFALHVLIEIERESSAAVKDYVNLAFPMLLSQIQRRVKRDQLTAAENGHAVADILHFLHVVRCQENG